MKKNLKILVELVFSQMWNLAKQLVLFIFSKMKNSYKLRLIIFLEIWIFLKNLIQFCLPNEKCPKNSSQI